MSIAEILILSVGLAMDACVISVCKGLSVRRVMLRHAFCVGLYFGIFQGLMPLIGYLLGTNFASLIVSVDHWIAFSLLSVLGLNMIKESFEEAECQNPSFSVKVMLPMAIATSIDALAIGISFAFLNVAVIPAVCSIAIITFALSVAGIYVGNIFGAKYKSKAEMVGGLVLVCMGIKILFEHLGIL